MIKAAINRVRGLVHPRPPDLAIRPSIEAIWRRVCFTSARLPLATGNVVNLRCCRDNGHKGAHCGVDLSRINVRLPLHVQLHGVVHLVAWFDFDPMRALKRIWTICGIHVETDNRTRRKKATTCIRCAARG